MRLSITPTLLLKPAITWSQSATGWGQVNMQSVFGNTSINCDKSLKITQQSSVYKEIRVKLLFKSKPSTISLSDCS